MTILDATCLALSVALVATLVADVMRRAGE